LGEGEVITQTSEEVIEMRHNLENPRISVTELLFYLIGALLLLLLGSIVANGQSQAPRARAAKAHEQVQQPLYKEYRSVRLGMTAAEVRAKLGEPALKSDEQDFYVFSEKETAQVAYDAAQKVVTISIDYAGGVGAPDYKSVVGEGLQQRPDGSVFRMVTYDSERFWVSYNKSGATVPTVTITIGAYK
jgi:outer membrane protein assembly factor BamE (lipoprotein component of BamABCDE complex)